MENVIYRLNSYARQTAPNLAERLKRGENLINFSQVSSCGTATAISVPCMFSSLNRANYDEAQANHRDNLLDTLQHAGVKVQWIENNAGCKDVCNRIPTVNTLDLQLPEYCTKGEYGDMAEIGTNSCFFAHILLQFDCFFRGKYSR
ncbi:sulfatase-like hydrolase/transferase [Exercitatus varius]|uniref:Sulfatase-like hydrolase/transferase n=1 Tax=Exercitatus varius TaxID=67857 RepID=A0AAW6Q806_9PAST|nr:sulfatase-like hydrolase/transferase [Exercitatus varius]MDG2949704.1 sulfatase-like hydrolase/transferase [Exercitatus varius]